MCMHYQRPVPKVKLSKDLEVACEIYRLTEVEGERVWFTKLVESLKHKMSKIDVSGATDTLIDWGIIDCEYGATENGRAGCLFYIDPDAKWRIKELYEATI